MVSLDNITKNGKALFLAYDQGLEHGPTDFNDENMDPSYVLKIGVTSHAYTGVIFQKGIAEKYYATAQWAGSIEEHVPLIVKLNGKTSFLKDVDPYSPQLCKVSEAVKMGAKAVGYTVYIGSEYENRMTEEFANACGAAHAEGLPMIGWMYPRGRAIDEKFKTPEGKKEITAYAARIGLELGADMVKLQYPGSQEALEYAVAAAGKTKVVVSGGHKESEVAFLELAKTVIVSGAIGMAVGRNVWQSNDPLGLSKRLHEIVFG